MSDQLVSSPMPELDTTCEALWVILKLTVSNVLYLFSVYGPPALPVDFVQNFSVALENLVTMYSKQSFPHVVMAEDFNSPKIDWSMSSASNDTDGKVLVNMLFDYNLTQLIKAPTRKSTSIKTENTLDLVITAYPDRISHLDIKRQRLTTVLSPSLSHRRSR